MKEEREGEEGEGSMLQKGGGRGGACVTEKRRKGRAYIRM